MEPQFYVALLALFGSVATLIGVLAAYLLRRLSPVERRLRDLTEPPTLASMVTTSALDTAHQSHGNLEAFARYVPKSPRELSKLGKRLASAGLERPEATVAYAAIELGLPVVAGLSVLWYFGPSRNSMFAAFVAAALGYLAPGLWLGQRTSARRRQIQNGLPDALDLLVVATEAGSGLDQAMTKVSHELRIAYPALAREMGLVISEIRAGRPRIEALRQFGERTKVDDVRKLVMSLVQTDRFGTSIGQTLRTHAEVARTKRRQLAEERAQKLGVKLVFPLVFCLFPAMYVVVLGPAVLRLIRILG